MKRHPSIESEIDGGFAHIMPDADKPPAGLNLGLIGLSLGVVAIGVLALLGLMFALGYAWTAGNLAAVAHLQSSLPIDFN